VTNSPEKILEIAPPDGWQAVFVSRDYTSFVDFREEELDQWELHEGRIWGKFSRPECERPSPEAESSLVTKTEGRPRGRYSMGEGGGNR
jgi:hypothetical protein